MKRSDELLQSAQILRRNQEQENAILEQMLEQIKEFFILILTRAFRECFPHQSEDHKVEEIKRRQTEPKFFKSP